MHGSPHGSQSIRASVASMASTAESKATIYKKGEEDGSAGRRWGSLARCPGPGQRPAPRLLGSLGILSRAVRLDRLPCRSSDGEATPRPI